MHYILCFVNYLYGSALSRHGHTGAREIGTFWRANKAHIWIPNIKQGFFGITMSTAEDIAKYK
jgi:hypothetical protein